MLSTFPRGVSCVSGGFFGIAAVLLGAVLVAGASAGFPGGESPDPARVRELIDAGHYPRAELAARELLHDAESARGPGSRAAADARDLLVAALIANSKAYEPETRELAGRAVEFREKLDGADSLAATESLLNRGRVFKENRKLEEAETVLERALGIRERELGPSHLEIAKVLNELGSVAYRGRKSGLAEQRFNRALGMLEVAVGASDPECAFSLQGLFAVSWQQRRFIDAEGYQLRSVAVREHSLGPHHPLTAESRRALAILWEDMGRIHEAEELLRQAVNSLEESLGPRHPQTGQTLNSLARLVRNQGRYAEARRLFERALVAFETSFDPLDPRIAGVLNNLASTQRELGDFAEAEACLRRSLEIREGRYGPDHPAVAQSLSNLAAVLIEAERHEEAIPLLERAIAIKERTYGPSSIEVATSLGNLGRALRAAGDLVRARSVLEEAVEILETELGSDDLRVADQLCNLALVRHEMGDFNAARSLLVRAVEIRRAAFGENDHRILRFQYNLARIDADAGNGDAAIAEALDAQRLGREHLQLTARGLSEEEAIRFGQYTRNRLDLVLELALRWPQHAAAAWDALIRSRGLVLNELVVRRRAASSEDVHVTALAAELTAATERLARLRVRGPARLSAEEFREELASARRDVERLERRMGDASAAFRDDRRRARIGRDDVVEAMPAGAALVGFARRSLFRDPIGAGSPDTFGYMAMVVAPGAAEPVPVELGPAPEIEGLVKKWRRAAVAPGTASAGSADEGAVRLAGEALRRRIWDPLAPLLKGAATVFVVPDGELGLLNLAALPTGRSGYLIETGPEIHMLDAERDLVVAPRSGFDERSVLLALGDPDFDWRDEGAAGSDAGRGRSMLRGSNGACTGLEEVVFGPLPTTGPEAELIAELWRRNLRGAIRLTGDEATEAAFKRLAPGKAVLHLATHGFVLGRSCAGGGVSGRGIGGLAPSRAAPEPENDPLLEVLGLAGLALAGANHRADAGPGEEDGVLTAMEIANLDLSSVEWAVLSACDTGVGESVSGEGVFGFRRAFRIAGARTVIMSLWPVEDEATSAWMELLYRARLEDGMSTAKSVRHAGLELLQRRREQGMSTHPFYWGAFIAAGDWR
ncbi:MAG: CHAT domain-containing tetratricopeptide repeat protein [Thermoanaerobaculales bacterium]|jgi:CHAT domain-containing protein/tetratricopeptide (TPR) repeat protein|nr:CHAT domain-containing tetratricopeptide repeat protein [Thermoanaerobaculales bacterium]